MELALTTGMRRGEICALRWSDLSDSAITVNHALGNGPVGFCVKERKTPGSNRTISLTKRINDTLHALRTDKQNTCKMVGIPFGIPYILGAIGLDSRPYNPSILSKEFTAFCKMGNFKCTFHDLRHTFTTFMIDSGVDVRTVASYLGHASVTMTLETYADEDPEAKRSAVGKIEEAFDDNGGFEVYRAMARRRRAQDKKKGSQAASLREKPASGLATEELHFLLVEAERREAM